MKKQQSSPRWGKYLLLCTFLGFNCMAYAQADSWKDDKLTLRVSNVPLGALLNQVAKAANADIELSGVTLKGIDNPTTLNVKNLPLDKILWKLIGNQSVRRRYESGRHIIVESYEKKIKADSSNDFLIGGQVVDKKTGQPVIGATLLIKTGRNCIVPWI